jgi:surface antigen
VVTLWIGDFRTKQLQNVYKAAAQTAEYHYIVDDLAEYSWFKNNATAQLPTLSLENANVVIGLGFNDCVYSCVWDSFKIDKIAEQYAEAINELVDDFTNFNFYVCSVNPINASYPFAESEGGIITKSKLSDKIGIFNNTLKEKCKAEYIDSYDYLVNTSFETRDGVRYTYDTCVILHNYISTHFKSSVASVFSPRLTEPNPNVDTYLYWTSTDADGANPFPKTTDGFTLPSCEAYAWGRFYEILGEEPALSTGSANAWYGFNDGYTRGEEPRVGAIACWQNATSGFVAVVEQVKEDGSIITSESDAITNEVWRLTERTKGLGGNWGMSLYTFKGFIYCPIITPTASVGSLDKSTVVAKPEALNRSEMEANAKYIWNYLGSKGWSLNAVAGMLGNMQYESTINPGRHQVGSGDSGGYGLVQWTPKSKIINWLSNNGYADDDMDGQLERILWEKENHEQYAKNKYKYTFETFTTSLDNPYTLACAFAFDYERSWVTLYGSEEAKETLRKERGTAAEEWYRFLAPFSPSAATIAEKFTLENFKLDNITPTEVKASFIVRNGIDGHYMLYIYDKSDTELLEGPLQIKADASRLQVVAFNCDNKIKPNEEYTLRIRVTGKVGENVLTRSITFKVPQSLPASAKSIKLLCKDKIKSVNSTFELTAEMPTELGYWGKNSKGYDKILFVDGEKVKTIAVKNLNNINSKKFTIKEEFGYTCKTGDVVQIGLRIWTTDNDGKKVYDSPKAKISEAICLLNRPVQVYLTK